MNRLPDGIWIINADATTLYANAAMGDILGIEAARLIGEPSFDYVFAEDVEAPQRLFDTRKRGDAARFHFKLRRVDGSAIWVDVQGTPMKNVEGEFIGIVGTFRVSEMQK